MPPTISDFGIDRLSAEDRFRLMQEIWDSLSPEDVPIPESHVVELQRRIAEADANPAAGKSWEEVKARLTGRQ